MNNLRAMFIAGVAPVGNCACKYSLIQEAGAGKSRFAHFRNSLRLYPTFFIVGSSSQADHLMRNVAMDDSIGGS